jgi:lipase chaperone LimK
MKGGMGEDEDTRGGPLRSQVLRSGVLLRLLQRARWHMRSAALRARTLGAWQLAHWASERADRLNTLANAESKSAGYAIRVHALSAWAAEVLT